MSDSTSVVFPAIRVIAPMNSPARRSRDERQDKLRRGGMRGRRPRLCGIRSQVGRLGIAILARSAGSHCAVGWTTVSWATQLTGRREPGGTALVARAAGGAAMWCWSLSS